MALLLALLAGFVGTASAAATTSTISGTVTAEVGGALLDQVEVCAYPVGGEGFKEHCVFTDSEGEYTIPGLAPGDYKVEFWPGFSSRNLQTQYWQEKKFIDVADLISLGEGENREWIDAELEEGGEITGKVTSAVGSNPVPKVLVCVELTCSETDGEGEYTISGLPTPDEYEVEFLPPAPYLHQFFKQSFHKRDAQKVKLETPGSESGIDAQLVEGAEIQGTVTAAANGTPLAGILICALESKGFLQEPCVDTDPFGRYELANLPPDQYKVAFSADFGGADEGFLTQFFNNKPTLDAADPIPLAAEATVTGINAALISNATAPPPAQSQVILVPAPPTTTPPVAKTPTKKCRPGFRKRKVKGKVRCVKVHHRRTNQQRQAQANGARPHR